MKSAASFGACVGVAFVVGLAACSRLDGPATSPSALRPTSSIEVRVERGGGSGGGGGTVEDDIEVVDGTFTFESSTETTSGTYLGFVNLNSPESVTLAIPEFRRSDDSVFRVPITSVDSSQTSVIVVLGVSPNPQIRIVDFRVELDQTFTATADTSCPTGERHTFVLTGQIPQFGKSKLTLTHCEAAL